LPASWLVPVLAFAQTDLHPQFEVAEVLINRGNAPPSVDILNGQLRVTGLTMRRLITLAHAYTIREGDLKGGPNWLDSDRFDVVAKASAGSSEQTMLGMLRTLLAERFGLKTHLENEARLVYVLSVASAGSKLQPASGSERGSCTPSSAGPEKTHLVCSNVTMGSLSRRLPLLTNLDLPMVDWTWEAPLGPGEQMNGMATLFASMKRLGLLVERRKHPTPVLVVDSVDRIPTE